MYRVVGKIWFQIMIVSFASHKQYLCISDRALQADFHRA